VTNPRRQRHRQMPTTLKGVAHRRQGLRECMYDEPESGQRDGRQIPSLPRVAWLERPELPETDIPT
jgi:hypothetical protein